LYTLNKQQPITAGEALADDALLLG